MMKMNHNNSNDHTEHTEHTGWTEWPPGSGEKRVRGFPWLSPDLNRLALEPTLLEAAERRASARPLSAPLPRIRGSIFPTKITKRSPLGGL